jgi:hypothetical protein
LRLELTLQVRQRFLHATVFSEVIWLAVLLPRQMPRARHPSSNLHRSTSKPPLIPRRLKSVPNMQRRDIDDAPSDSGETAGKHDSEQLARSCGS